MSRGIMRGIPAIALVLLLGSSLGCGSTTGGQVLTTPQMGWMDDGTQVIPFGADATLTSSSGTDSYRIDGLTQGRGSVTIILTAPTPIVPQAFDCSQLASGQTVLVSWADGDGGFDISDQSCKVVITQVGKAGGAPLIGTFEAVINLTPSGTKTLSNGVFKLPVQM
jgi:hypothetical protein